MKKKLIMGLALAGIMAFSAQAQTRPRTTGSQNGTYQTQPTTTNSQYNPASTTTQQPTGTLPNPQNSNTGNNNTQGVTNHTHQEQMMQEGNTRRNRNMNRSMDQTTEQMMNKRQKKRMERRMDTGRTTRPRSRTNP